MPLEKDNFACKSSQEKINYYNLLLIDTNYKNYNIYVFIAIIH
jgi:hypothetical protein